MSSFPYTHEDMKSMEDYTLDGSLNFHGSFSSFISNGNDIDMNQIIHLERPKKQPRSTSASSNLSNSQIISFGNGVVTAGIVKPKHDEADSSANPDHLVCQSSYISNGNPPSIPSSSNGGMISRSRNPFKAQHHVLAERKRREKLSQRLIALSAVIPTLKKMDKATVLEDAVKYIKQLEQRINILEKEIATKSMESVVVTGKKSLASADDDIVLSSSSYHTSNKQEFSSKLLEIEARVSEKYVLIRVHCERRSITRILDLVEKMKLRVLSHSIMQFGSSILDITIVAQIEAEFDMTIEELVKKLRQDLLHSM